jgi:tape measure domain-containing protein
MQAGQNVAGLSKDYGELIRAVRASESAMERSGQSARRMGSDYGNLQKTLMKIGGAAALARLGKEMIDVRGEMEMMAKSFGVLTGSEREAAAMLRELKDVAVKSPLTLTAITEGAQMLMGYNIEAGRTVEVIKQMSDISMGRADKFQSLILAFSQMSAAGQVLSQDIRQMATAGFNPLTEIARTTGKSFQEVNKSMHDGALSVEQVTEAFRTATAEGGKFHGMTEKQAEGLVGLKASLGDAWTNMLNEIGENQQGLISEGYKLSTSLVQNYEAVGKALVGLIATYGTYRVAVLLATAAKEWGTLAHAIHATTLLKVEKVQRLLNKTMLSNPYVLVATAVMGLAMAVWTLYKRTDEQSASLKRLKALQDEHTRSVEAERVQIDLLFGRLKAAKEGTEAYQRAKDNIVSKYGTYLEGLSEEVRSLKDVESAYKAISEAAIRAAKDRAIEKGSQDAVDAYTKVWADKIKNIRTKFVEKFGEVQGELLLDSLKESLGSGGELSKEVQKAIRAFDENFSMERVEGVGGAWDTSPNKITADLEKIDRAKDILNREIKGLESIFGEARPKAGNEGEAPMFSDINTELKEAQDNVDRLKKKVDELRSGQMQSMNYAQDIEDAEKALDTAEKRLASLTGKDKKNAAKGESSAGKAQKEAQAQADAARKLIDGEAKAGLERRAVALENEQKLLDIQRDGFDKQEQQIDLNHKKELLARDKHARELLEKQQEVERLEWEKAGKTGTFTPQTVSVLQLPKEQRDELAQQTTTADAAHRAATEQLYKDQLEAYRTFAQKRLDIEKEYQATLAALRKSGASEENLRIAEQMQDDALAALDEEAAQKEAAFQDFMRRIGYMSLVQLEASLKEAENALRESAATNGKDSKQTGILRAKIQKLQEEIRAVKAEEEVKESDPAAKWDRTSKAIKNCKKEVDGILGSMDFLDESTRSALQAASNVADGAIAMIDGIQMLGTGAAQSLSAVEKASVILAIIGAAVQIVTAIFNMAAAAEEQHQAALEEVMRNKLAFQRQYNLLLLEQNLLLKEATSIFGENQIERAANAMKVYREAVELFRETMRGKRPDELLSAEGVQNWMADPAGYRDMINAYDRGIGALSDIVIKTGHEKTGFLGWGSGRDVYSSILDVYGEDALLNPDGSLNIDFAQTILDTQTLTDESRELLQSLIDIQEKANEAQEALREYLQETFGELGGDLMDAIVASIQDKGVDAWETFGDAGAKVIENLGKQLAYELFFADKFAKLQKDLEAIYGETSDPEAIARRQMELMGAFYQTIGADMEAAQAFMENWQKKASEYGFDLWQGEGEGQSGRAGDFTTMTQDQGTKLEGLFTSVQMHAARIDEQVADVSAAMYAALDTLMRIAENTEYCRFLEDMAADLALIKRDGLKMK